jgi:WD40 repeat protein/energy-coupling factor transporter ATP-binding protein EcfA2
MTGRAFRFNPFPGLRPFRESETHLFFGRNAQVDELLTELARSRFVAVMGASGSGKSSLVTAGLLPALHGGLSKELGAAWRIASFRPGGNPIRNLATALAAPNVLGVEGSDPSTNSDHLEATLRRSALGLADAARREQGTRDGRVLVVVDQFEELFRFQGATNDVRPSDRSDFVQLLIEAARDGDAHVDVIITMRSDYLGDCAQFEQLPETINDGLYLVPRLTRSQMREAITGPVAVGGGTIAPRLVQRILNDARSDPDVLPVVQHALMRTWDLWAAEGATKSPIDLVHYEAGGGLEEALARHADEALHELSDDRGRRIAELTFKRLTELDVDGREGRRPSPLVEIAAVAGATVDEVNDVIGRFAQQGRSFLNVSNDGVVDISHESLIRQWPRLRNWVRAEARSRDIYRRLTNAAERWGRGEAALLRDPDLQIATNWWAETLPNQVWADRYDPGFEPAVAYLDRSRRAATRRRLSIAAGALGLGVLAVVFGLLTLRANRSERLAVARQLSAVSVELGPEQRTQSILTALQALRTTEGDGFRLPEAEEALRGAMGDPLGVRLPDALGQQGHTEEITSLSLSPDGRWLATGSLDDTALLWDLQSPTQDPTPLQGHQDDVVVVAFDPTGKWLATADSAGGALLWDMQDREAGPVSLPGHHGRVMALAFSPDGNWVATGGEDSTVWLSDHSARSEEDLRLETDGFVITLAFSPDGSRLAAGNGDDLARVWDMGETGSSPKELGHDGDVSALAFSPDSQSLATGSRDGNARIWDLTARSPEPLSLPHGDSVLGVAISPDGRWLATGGENNAARLWDLTNTARVADTSVPLVHSGSVEEVAFTADGLLVTGGHDNAASLYDPNHLTVEPTALGGPVSALTVNLNTNQVAIGSDEGSARIWDLDQRTTEPAILPHDADVTALAFHPDGDQLATGTADNEVNLWNVDDAGAEPTDLPSEKIEKFPDAQVEALDFSPGGEVLVAGGGDQVLRIWDLESSRLEATEESLQHAIHALDFSPDGSLLAIGLDDNRVLLRTVDDGDARPLHGHNADVTSIAFSANGEWLASGDQVGKILLWDPSDLDAGPISLGTVEGSVLTLEFSHDSARLVSGSRGGAVSVWSVPSGDSETVFLGDPVPSVAFSADGSLLAVAATTALLLDPDASRSADQTVRPVVLSSHREAVTEVAFSPSGGLATGSADDTVRLWLSVEDLVELACRTAGRNLTEEEWKELVPGQPYAKTCEQWP